MVDTEDSLLKIKFQHLERMLDFPSMAIPDSLKRFQGLKNAESLGDVLTFVEDGQEFYQDDVYIKILFEVVNFFWQNIEETQKEFRSVFKYFLEEIIKLQREVVDSKKQVEYFQSRFSEYSNMKVLMDTTVAGMNSVITTYNELFDKFNLASEKLKDEIVEDTTIEVAQPVVISEAAENINTNLENTKKRKVYLKRGENVE